MQLKWLGYFVALTLEYSRDVSQVKKFRLDLLKRDPSQNGQGIEIKNELQPVLDRIGMRKDLHFIENSQTGGCAFGVNQVAKGDAVIFLSRGLYNVDKEACFFVAKHEIHHIKSNDCLMLPSVHFIVQLVVLALGIYYRPSQLVFFFGVKVGYVVKSLFSIWREARCDQFAIENSSSEELKGGRRYFKAEMARNAGHRKTWLDRMFISAQGDYRLDMEHPPLSSRVKKIEKELRKRNILWDPQEEEKRVRALQKYFVQFEKDALSPWLPMSL